MKFKNHTITKTNTTTDSYRTVFGKQYNCVKFLYNISGPKINTTNLWDRPTSIADCKKLINGDY